MLRNTKTGRFCTTTQSQASIKLKELPKTTLGVIKLYQNYGILPPEQTIRKGFTVPLIPKTTKKYGDKLNDSFKLYNGPLNKYQSVRPVLGYQDKLPLTETLEILYYCAKDFSHKEIAGLFGKVHYKDNTTDVNNAPVTRIRSNL